MSWLHMISASSATKQKIIEKTPKTKKTHNKLKTNKQKSEATTI